MGPMWKIQGMRPISNNMKRICLALLALCSLSYPAGAAIMTPNLVAAYRFEGNANDWATRASNYLVFNGANNYVGTGKTLIPAGGNNYTVETRFYANGVPSGLRELVAQWTNANSGNSFFLGFSNDNIRFSDNWNDVDIGAWTTNAWHTLTAVSTSNNAYIYFDGQLAATKDSALSYTGTGPVILGRQGELNGEDFNGRIGEVRVYTRALSAAEVLALYNGQTVSRTGLAGEWLMTEGSGAAIADTSGNGNNGTIYGAAWGNGQNGVVNGSGLTAGKFGQAYSFDGASNYIQIASSLYLGNAATISAWVKNDVWGAGNTDTVIDLYDSANSTVLRDIFTIKYWSSNQQLNAMMYDSANVWYNAGANVTYSTSQWYHVAITRNAASLKIYINGTESGSNNNVGSNNFHTFDSIRIGNSSVGETWAGKIDEVRIYNRALNAAEIRALMLGYEPGEF